MKLMISEDDIIYLQMNNYTSEDYYYSKLCFLNDTANSRSKNIIINEGNDLRYNKEKDEYFFPYDINEYQRCFLLRLIVDSIQLKRGNLPMHTAAISDGKETFIIAAESGGGKSYISNEICRLFQKYDTIGDDHIIISSGYIQGNKKRRIRNINTEVCEYFENKALCPINALTFICYEFSSCGNYTVGLSESEVWKALASQSAFKYLNETFVHNHISYQADAITDIRINEVYQQRLFHFLHGRKAIYIHGTQKYAVEYISNQIKRRYL